MFMFGFISPFLILIIVQFPHLCYQLYLFRYRILTVSFLFNLSHISSSFLSIVRLQIFLETYFHIYDISLHSIQSHLYQGRTSGGALFLLACIHPVTPCRAGWSYIIHGRLEFHHTRPAGVSSIYIIWQLYASRTMHISQNNTCPLVLPWYR